jgi:hypothetical protein
VARVVMLPCLLILVALGIVHLWSR